MRNKNNRLLPPIIECDEKTFSWLAQLPVNQINSKNLKWHQFLILHKMMNTTILVAVEFNAMTAKIRVTFNPKADKNGYKEKPAFRAEVKFVLDRICVDEVTGEWTPYTISMTERRIVPIIRFLLSSEKYDVILKLKDDKNKRNSNQVVYNFIRTTNVFGQTFEFTDLLSLESVNKLSQRGAVVTVNENAVGWLESFCKKIRQMELEVNKETNTKRYKGAMFDSSLELDALKSISAIRVSGEFGFLQLQLRSINNVAEVAYYENGSNKCQMLLYLDCNSESNEIEVFYHENDPEYRSNAQKIAGLLQNVLLYFRTWDWSISKNPNEGNWKMCELRPLPSSFIMV